MQLRPPVIPLDVIMPGEDGYTCCYSMKTDPALRGIPIIFMTARLRPERICRR